MTGSRAAKIIGIVFAVYVGIVVLFESLLGYFQPEAGSTIVITTTDENGSSHDRVVSLLESDGEYYVAANHWPRAWYRQARENPEVEVSLDGEPEPYRAVPVSEQTHERLSEEHAHSLVFLFLTGFPPREFLRLEPIEEG